MAKRQKELQAFAFPPPPDFKVVFLQACWKKHWCRGKEWERGGFFISNDKFLAQFMARIVWILKKSLNRGALYMKISKYKKIKSILPQFASCHLIFHMAKIAYSEMRRKFILTSIKMRKLSCMFTQHQNKLSGKRLIEGSGDHRRFWWSFLTWVQRGCQAREESGHSVPPCWILSQNCLENVLSTEVLNHFLLKTVSMFFLTIYYCTT